MPEFFEIVREQFSFLESEYGFLLQSEDDNERYSEVIYVNDTTGVKITYEYSYAYIFVVVCRLVGGAIVDNPPSINHGATINCFDFDDMLDESVRMKPTYDYDSESHHIRDEDGFSNYIAGFAANLQKYGKDLLNGDFSVLPEIEKKIRARVAEYRSH